MSGTRYSDSPSGAPSSPSSSSYTDRFRVDDRFPSDFPSAPAADSRAVRPQLTETMLVTLIGKCTADRKNCLC